ncbi:MAG: Efflux ABC transporter, permease protein, partial [uncultured Frankineae bacterium]
EHRDDVLRDCVLGRGRRGRGPQGHLVHGAPAPGHAAVRRPDVRLARDAQGQARPGAAAGRDGDAGDVRADVHLPVRRRHRGFHGRLPRLPAAGHPGDVGAVHDRLLRDRPEHRPDQGGRGPLPVPARLAPRAAAGLAARRCRALRRGGDRDHRARAAAGLPAGRRCDRRRLGARPGRAVLVRAVLVLHDAGAAAPNAERRHERRVPGDLPADLPVQRLRRPHDPAVGAARLRGRQPRLGARDGVARPDGGHRLGQRRRRRAGGRRGADGGVRSGDVGALPPEL